MVKNKANTANTKLSPPGDSQTATVQVNDTPLRNDRLTNTRAGGAIDTQFELDDQLRNAGPGGDTLSEKIADQKNPNNPNNQKNNDMNDGPESPSPSTAPTPSPY